MHSGHSYTRSLLISAGGVVALLLLTACPKVQVPKKIPGTSGDSKLDVKVHVSPKANNNNPVAVDLVLVSNKKLLQELMKMSAHDWFEKRHQIELDYPKETGLAAGRWEWVPGQEVQVDRVTVKFETVGGVIFANYFTPGTHRAAIDPRKPILVTLGEDSLCVQSLKEVAKPCTPSK